MIEVNSMIMLEPLIVEFLVAYAESMEWKDKDISHICKMLCEKYQYDDEERGRKFVQLALGWMWGRTPGPLGMVDASIKAAILKTHLDVVYKDICEENGW